MSLGPTGIWDPINEKEVELETMTTHTAHTGSGWTAKFLDTNGNSYTVTCVENGKTKTGDDAPNQNSKNLGWDPVDKEGAKEFVEKAWPINSPSSSVPSRQPSQSAGKSSVSSEDEMIFGGNKAVVGAEIRCKLGSKPMGNQGHVLETSVLTNMTLMEHIENVKMYSCPLEFRNAMPDSLSQALWDELVEVFINYHAYDVEDPEVMVWSIKRMYCQQSPGFS